MPHHKKNYCAVKKYLVIAEGLLDNFLEFEPYVFCITITALRSLTFKAGKLNHFSQAPIKDRYRWKIMVLWVHGTTLTTKSEAATC